MRQFCVCVFAGLLVLAFLQSAVMANHSNVPDECCFTYYRSRIPTSKIVSYRETRMDCTKQGVIIVTQKGFKVCVNPRFSWVQKVMQQIDNVQF